MTMTWKSTSADNEQDLLFGTSVDESGELEQSVEEHIPDSSQSGHMNKEQLINLILLRNPGTTPQWLESFSCDMLAGYLAHLDTLDSPRGTVWQRPGDSPAILEYESAF